MTQNTHIMKLQPGPFDRIKSGQKIIESRLYDEKRRSIQLGDEIEFQRNPDLEETIKVDVVGLLNYPMFEDLMNDFAPKLFGGETKEGLLNEISEFYSIEDQKEYSVLGIKIKLQK